MSSLESHGDQYPDYDDRYQKETALVEFLIDNGANVNVSDGLWTPLEQAFYKDAVNTVVLLASKGADVNVRDSDGDTLLCAAKRYEMPNKEMIAALKRAGAVAERGEPYPVDDSASQTDLITSAVNAAAMAAIVDSDNVLETGGSRRSSHYRFKQCRNCAE